MRGYSKTKHFDAAMKSMKKGFEKELKFSTNFEAASGAKVTADEPAKESSSDEPCSSTKSGSKDVGGAGMDWDKAALPPHLYEEHQRN